MEVIELKSHIYKFVDATENEHTLQTLYDFLKLKENETGILIWESLDQEQKNEVLLAYEDSEQPENLVDARTVFKSFK